MAIKDIDIFLTPVALAKLCKKTFPLPHPVCFVEEVEACFRLLLSSNIIVNLSHSILS